MYFFFAVHDYRTNTFIVTHCVIQVGLDEPEEADISLASNLERQLLYSARPSLFDNKPVSIYIQK